ncbi:unnamed protein product [Caenorhabditis bovis]|uniref:C2H2-type domain-containing protein n=1 Tax=Caenorhabditis bovis TaxID=2654633 RepID=A0A8S1ERL9_9PELO|nr:unnamed protein product [Caenorhabditis bovis]
MSSFLNSAEMSTTAHLNLPTLDDLIAKFAIQNQASMQLFQSQMLCQAMASLTPTIPTVPLFNFCNPDLLQQILNVNPATLAAVASLQNTETSTKNAAKMRREHTMQKSMSLDAESSSSYDVNHGDIIVPSSDKEGWCRNKKYIEKTDTGFMCTVCRKVYGRYNSVSYHVTIYHRNPPIKCNMPNCQFTTREARYIHFHKYYRHGIALPHSIDQGSRKCPHCRHVSKSPAMLEKHIKRHQIREDQIDPVESIRNRTATISEIQVEAMDVDEFETKPRSCTL